MSTDTSLDLAIALSRARRMLKTGEAQRIRRAAGLTQAELAEAVGVTLGAVAQWERGRTRPGNQAGRRYAEVLMALAAEVAGDEE